MTGGRCHASESMCGSAVAVKLPRVLSARTSTPAVDLLVAVQGTALDPQAPQPLLAADASLPSSSLNPVYFVVFLSFLGLFKASLLV